MRHGPNSLPETDFAFVAREMRARTGQQITPDKIDLVEARAAPIARREGFLSVQDLITTTRARRDDRLVNAICEQLIATDTHFFRDRHVFAHFQRAIYPALSAARGEDGRVRIWSAGCGGGQEPYSIAMAVEDMKADGLIADCDLLATDISQRQIEKARAGLYTQFEVQRGLPIQMLVRHFEKHDDSWKISDRIRAKARFQSFNLLASPGPLGVFDVIFCRNVLSAFGAEERADAITRLIGALAPDGALILGAEEAIGGHGEEWAAAAPGVFSRRIAARRAA